MGLFGGGNSSTSSTVNNYDQRAITETNTENDGEFAGNAGTVNYSITDGGAFDFAETLSGDAFAFAETVVDTLEESDRNTQEANKELFSSLAKQQSEILTGGQQGIIDTLSKNFKWAFVAAAVAYAVSRLKA